MASENLFNLKRVIKNYLNPLLPSVAFLYPILISKYQNAIGFLMFYWCYKKATVGSNGLKKTAFKKADEKIFYRGLPWHNHCFWFLLIFEPCSWGKGLLGETKGVEETMIFVTSVLSHQYRRSSVFIVNIKHTSRLFLVTLSNIYYGAFLKAVNYRTGQYL